MHSVITWGMRAILALLFVIYFSIVSVLLIHGLEIHVWLTAKSVHNLVGFAIGMTFFGGFAIFIYYLIGILCLTNRDYLSNPFHFKLSEK